MKPFIQKYPENITAVILWLIIFPVYLFTLAPTVGFIDSGELATVACTLGIAHPTGYPLFTLVGRIFSILPIAAKEIVRLNVMSALFTSIAAIVFFFLAMELLGRKVERFLKIISAGFATLFLAFSKTFWDQAVSVEVYSLHLLLICLTTLFFIKAINEDESSFWYLFAYTLGLAFTNHLTTILLAPAFLFLFFMEYKFAKAAVDRILKLTLPFFLGLSAYLYLPIRSASSPLLNWGNPQTFEKFWWHFTGKQFRVWMFSSTDAAKKQFDYFLQSTLKEFYYIPLLFFLAGALIVLFSDRKKFFFIALLLVSCVAYSINYDIHDIDSYFLLAFISLMLFATFGILKLIESITWKFGGIILACILSLQVTKNWAEVDQSKNYIVEDYTKNILNNLPLNSTILSYQWDYFVSASYYFQYVEKFRPDVIVLDKELFRRSWYFNQMNTMHPVITSRSRTEIDLFLGELYKFEHDLPYEFNSIESRYVNMLESIFSKSGTDTLCFVTSEIEANYTNGFYRVPFGFAQLLTKDTSYVEVPHLQFIFRSNNVDNPYSIQLKKLGSSILLQRSMYEKFHGNMSASSKYQTAAYEILTSKNSFVINF